MRENDFPIYTPSAEALPERLFEIPDPPETLRARGTLPLKDSKYLAVVGSRKYSPYGESACEMLIQGLCGTKIVIVSGLALGIDGVAHRSALEAGLPTMAIPGSGLGDDVLYPRTNLGLAREILTEGGALLSPFSDDWRPRPESFPERNRIMAGISHATLIIEANERSGTLITARLALEYNRDVGVVPGSIFSASAKGSNNLLRHGAFPITSSEDVLELLDLPIPSDREETRISETLTKEEQTIYTLLDEPKSKDELLEMLDFPVHETNIILSGMEIKGLIFERMGKICKSR